MINNVVLVGRMTRDADFINCVMWRQQAENLANWAKKGSLIGVTGRIQTRNYENNDGQRVYVIEVVADSFQMLESRNQQSSNDAFGNENPMDIQDDDLPF